MLSQKLLAESKRVNVVLDTNFFIDMFRFKIGFDEIENVVRAPCNFIMVHQSIDELRRLETKYARVGLNFIDTGKIVLVDAPGTTADDAITHLASSSKRKGNDKGFVFATNDAKLRKKIKGLGARVIYLRARKHLEMTN